MAPDSAIRAAAQPLGCSGGAAGDYAGLLALIGDARLVLLGEATHGTHEFYAERARLTARLIAEKGFRAVAVEADWPDAYRVNRYVRGEGCDRCATHALAGFRRFPSWMWRNTDVLAFIEWLCSHNRGVSSQDQVGFYGLDLYSLFTSIAEVLHYLEQVDPAAARAARQRYACFDHYGDDSRRYAEATGFGWSDSCADGVVAQLVALQQRGMDYLRDGPEAADAYFHAQQNARLVMHAEEYYRTMFHASVSSWNLRDWHMADTLDALEQHLRGAGTARAAVPGQAATAPQSGKPAKLIVWAHNSHIGDARATEAARLGEWNLGQLVRERHGEAVRLIGFSTYDGWVTAASRWDGRAERKRVRPALPDSVEALLHRSGPERFVLPLVPGSAAAQALQARRLERAIGVLYLPESERQSHYFYAQPAQQFDAIIHIDHSDAVQELEPSGGLTDGELPETYPVGV